MEQKIKTIADVRQVPETECITGLTQQNGICPFCGAKLPWKRIIIRRKYPIHSCSYIKYYPCDCPTALAAVGHNYMAQALQKEASLRRLAESKQE